MKLLLLAFLCAATGGSRATPTVRDHVPLWSEDDLEQSVRDLRADIRARLALLEGGDHPGPAAGHALRPPPPPSVSSGEGLLVTRDRAGQHIFRMRGGLAVDAQLGSDRVYRIWEGALVSEVCVSADGGRRACARRYKPAFYCLVAAGCLLAVLAVAFACSELARRRRRRRAAAAGDRCRLLFDGVSGGNGDSLSIKHDPVLLGGRCDHEKKFAI